MAGHSDPALDSHSFNTDSVLQSPVGRSYQNVGGDPFPDHMSQRGLNLGTSGEHPPEGPHSMGGVGGFGSSLEDRADEFRPAWIRPRSDVHTGPCPRSHSSAVLHDGKVWVFGGYGGERQARMHLGDLICLHTHDEGAKLWEPDELLEWSRPEVLCPSLSTPLQRPCQCCILPGHVSRPIPGATSTNTKTFCFRGRYMECRQRQEADTALALSRTS